MTSSKTSRKKTTASNDLTLAFENVTINDDGSHSDFDFSVITFKNNTQEVEFVLTAEPHFSKKYGLYLSVNLNVHECYDNATHLLFSKELNAPDSLMICSQKKPFKYLFTHDPELFDTLLKKISPAIQHVIHAQAANQLSKEMKTNLSNPPSNLFKKTRI